MDVLFNCLAVGAGGFLGSILRYLTGLAMVKERFNLNFPISTFLINIVGAFALGIISGLALKNSSLDPRLILFLQVGLCGGFTTFSTFSAETAGLFNSGMPGFALLYALGSVVIGVLAVFAAQALVR
jgi:CrcB protein